MDRGDNFYLVEALSRPHYEMNHLRGAIKLPYEHVDEAEEVLPDKRAAIVIYCINEECEASREKARELEEKGYRHEGSLGEHRLSLGEATIGRVLRVVPITNGPYLLRGEVEIRDATGRSACRGSKALLCRCGRSENKPFCDGSHARTGWREDQ